MDPDLLKLIGSGGFFAALLYLLYLVGMRIVAALDRVTAKLDKVDEAVVRVEAMLTERRTPVQGVPIMGGYGPQRPGSRGG